MQWSSLKCWLIIVLTGVGGVVRFLAPIQAEVVCGGGGDEGTQECGSLPAEYHGHGMDETIEPMIEEGFVLDLSPTKTDDESHHNKPSGALLS